MAVEFESVTGKGVLIEASDFTVASAGGTDGSMLHSFKLPPNTFGLDGDLMEFTFAGRFMGGCNKCVRIRLGGEHLYTSPLGAYDNDWVMSGEIARINGDRVKCVFQILIGESSKAGEHGLSACATSTHRGLNFGSSLTLEVVGFSYPVGEVKPGSKDVYQEYSWLRKFGA